MRAGGRRLEAGRACREWPDAHTVAFGINVAKPLGDFLVLDALYETDGVAIAVSDQELLEDLAPVRASRGTCVPGGAATLTAVRRLREQGWLERGERVVVLNTGSGLKYPESVGARARGGCGRAPAWTR